VFAVLILSERLTWIQIVSGAAIASAIVLARPRESLASELDAAAPATPPGR
jgi:hypothetical protein